MRTHQCSKRFSRGTSLLEAIAYLGVASIIVAGAVALLSTAFSSSRSLRAQQEITAIGTGVKRLFMSQAGAYGNGSLNVQLARSKIFPATLAVAGDQITNAWDGAVQVTGHGATFDLSYGGVPQDACIELAAMPGQWLGVSVNGGEAAAAPVGVAQAAAMCDQMSSNAIVWTAR